MIAENNIAVFDNNTLDYDNWFERHPAIYQSELLALKQAIQKNKKGIEIAQINKESHAQSELQSALLELEYEDL